MIIKIVQGWGFSREKLVFTGTVGKTGKNWEILGQTGIYWYKLGYRLKRGYYLI